MRGANPHFECSETLLPVDALTLQTWGTPTDYMILQKLEKQILDKSAYSASEGGKTNIGNKMIKLLV